MQPDHRALIRLLFVFSGAAGLLYEIAWAKLLALFLGNTAYAQATVIGVFMAGLAAGSIWFGRVADRSSSPLRLYAWLEIGIGVLGFLFPALLNFLSRFYVALAAGTEETPKLIWLRLLISALAVFVPTLLMGGTLPALGRFFIAQPGATRENVARLYYLNCLGAVLGALVAGFVLIQWIGVPGTIFGAATINVAVGLVSFWLAKRLTSPSPGESQDGEGGRRLRAPTGRDQHTEAAGRRAEAPPEEAIRENERSGHGTVLPALFLSGFAAMAYQICLIRMVAIGFGSTVYSFTIIVAAFIAGISIGSAVIGRVRVRDHVRAFSLVQWGIVLAFLLQLPLYRRSPYFAVQVRTAFDLTAGGFYAAEATKAVVVMLLLLVPTALMGMTFPLAAQVHSARQRAVGANVGLVYGFNTVGNLLGAILASVLLLPWLGLEKTFALALAFNFLAGALVVGAMQRLPVLHRWLAAGVTAVAAAALLLWNLGWTVPINHTVESLRVHSDPPASFEEFSKRFVRYPPKFMQEDANATVVVYESLEDPVLAVNGKIQATGIGDVMTEILHAHIPLSLHPDAQDVLVVGLGSGVTVGAALQHPIARIDVIELSPAVVEAARSQFAPHNHEFWKDPRARLIVEDGAAFLKVTRNKYDVVLNTLSHPWVAGVGNLFAVEYFRDCAEHLNPDGVVLLWVHLYEMDNETARLMIRTFMHVFPHVSTWMSQQDGLLIGSRSPIRHDLEAIRRRLSSDTISNDLSRLGLDYPPLLLSHHLFDEEGSRRLAGKGAVNSQVHPVLDFRAALALFRNVHATLLSDAFARMYHEGDLPPLLAEQNRQQPLSEEDYQGIIAHLSRDLRSDDPILDFYRKKRK